MKLSQAVGAYVAYKQSLGMRFATEARTLKSFYRSLDDVDVNQVEPARVCAYLAGAGPVTRFWHRKLGALRGFYRFALARGYATCSPLPSAVPEQPPAFVPYIYSRDDIKRLLEATAGRERCNLYPAVSASLARGANGANARYGPIPSWSCRGLPANVSRNSACSSIAAGNR